MTEQPGRESVLITGGAGFLGRAITNRLSGTRDVTIVQRRPVSIPGVVSIAADIRDAGAMSRTMAGMSVVIHAAGLAHVFDNARQAPFSAVNEGGTREVTRAAVAAGVRHVILVSSVAVYGGGSRGAAEEDECRPRTPYGTSKLAAEVSAAEAVAGSSTRLTVLRMATIYGERDRGNVQRLLRAIDSGWFVRIGDGRNRKSLIHVDDAASACALPIDSPGAPVETFNVSAPAVQMRDIIDGLASALGRRVSAWHLPAAIATLPAAVIAAVVPAKGAALRDSLGKWLADDVYPADKFERRFSFVPEVSLSDGLLRQVRWWRSARNADATS